MTSDQLVSQINNLNIWKKGDQRAPHKPLLILYALGRLKNGQSGMMSYEEAREPLKQLLIDFGPYRLSYHPEEPFVRLTRDGIWRLNQDLDKVEVNSKWLVEHGILGGFSDDVRKLFDENLGLIREVAEIILQSHFPDSMHEDILSAVGLDLDFVLRRVRIRDPKFRDKILIAYRYSCAVCGFNVRLGNQLVGVEAAHIKWHQAGGPDSEENGIALCSMHHKLYDRGVFTIAQTKQIVVSERAHGTSGFDDWLMRYHGKHIQSPTQKKYYPEDEFINWNVREVFKGEGREYF